EGVVDALEVVQVEEDDAERPPAALGPAQLALQRLIQVPAVGQPRERGARGLLAPAFPQPPAGGGGGRPAGDRVGQALLGGGRPRRGGGGGRGPGGGGPPRAPPAPAGRPAPPPGQ